MSPRATSSCSLSTGPCLARPEPASSSSNGHWPLSASQEAARVRDEPSPSQGLLLGTVSGSGVANTVTLGSVAWPMLKRAGYKPDMGGAILSAAGIGAIICPPALGAAAFIIAEFLHITYLQGHRDGVDPGAALLLLHLPDDRGGYAPGGRAPGDRSRRRRCGSSRSATAITSSPSSASR